MKHLFLDSHGRLRNGWWILVFAALMVASRFAYTPISRALQAIGADTTWLDPLRYGFVLAVTWICLRLRREPLSAVGFRLDARWARELLAGAGLGLASALLVVARIWAAGGVRLELDPARSVATLNVAAARGIRAYLRRNPALPHARQAACAARGRPGDRA